MAFFFFFFLRCYISLNKTKRQKIPECVGQSVCVMEINFVSNQIPVSTEGKFSVSDCGQDNARLRFPDKFPWFMERGWIAQPEKVATLSNFSLPWDECQIEFSGEPWVLRDEEGSYAGDCCWSLFLFCCHLFVQ